LVARGSERRLCNRAMSVDTSGSEDEGGRQALQSIQKRVPVCVAVSSSKAVTSCLVQEEIRRDLAREVELRQEAKRRLQEDTSLSGDSLDGDERGRRRGRSKVSERSHSSHGEKRKVYFGGEPVQEISTSSVAPSYTIFREGGQGFTKYTVYAKQQQAKREVTNKKSVKRAPATSKPMEVQGSITGRGPVRRRDRSLPGRHVRIEELLDRYTPQERGESEFKKESSRPPPSLAFGPASLSRQQGKGPGKHKAQPEEIIKEELRQMKVREADLKRRQLVIQAMGPSGGKTS